MEVKGDKMNKKHRQITCEINLKARYEFSLSNLSTQRRDSLGVVEAFEDEYEDKNTRGSTIR